MNLRGIGCVVSLLSLVGIIVVLFDRHWEISVPYTGQPGGAIHITEFHAGLWHRCQNTGELGRASCDKYYQSIAHLPPALIGQRALTCMAAILGVAGFVAAVSSSNAVNIAKSTNDKNSAGKTAGVLFVLAGLFVGIAVSWAAGIIIQDNKITWVTHSNAGNGKVYYTLGNDIYIGWVSALLGIVAGALLLMGSCRNAEEDDYDVNDTMYNGSHPGYTKGYAESQTGNQRNEYL